LLSLARPAAAPFGTGDSTPILDPLFSDLHAAVGDLGSDPAECAHPVLGGGAIVQHLARGGAVLNVDTGDATFTDGSRYATLGG
jgi:hypothetical protein